MAKLSHNLEIVLLATFPRYRNLGTDFFKAASLINQEYDTYAEYAMEKIFFWEKPDKKYAKSKLLKL